MSLDERRELLAKLQQNKQQNDLAAVDMPSAWKLSDKGRAAISKAVKMSAVKHGLYASIPMLCKAEECPYAPVCPLIADGEAPLGERCPIEIAMIITKYEDYATEFQVDETNVVDMGLIKDLIDYDIQLMRAENKIAVQGDFIEDVVVSVSESGQEITAPRLSQATEYKDRIMNKKFKVLELMNSTRKAKAGDKMTISLDPSSYASQLMAQVASDMKPGQIIDAEFEEIDDE